MKKITLVLMSLLGIYQCHAQRGTYASAIGADIVASFPTGHFRAGAGYGIKPNYVYMVAGNVGLLAEVGYLNWAEMRTGSEGFIDRSAFLINGGLRVNVAPDQGLYVYSTAGVHVLMSEYSEEINNGFRHYRLTSSHSKGEVNIAGGLGWEVAISNDLYVNVSGNYNYIIIDSEHAAAYIGVNIGMRLGFF